MKNRLTGCRRRPVFRLPGAEDSESGRSGFTLLEVLFVAVLAALTLGVASYSYATYMERSASSRAAKLFALDLSRARGAAVRQRQSVVIRFDEADLSYEVETASGRILETRDYGDDGDVPLSEMDLDLAGDSVVFNGRGVADLGGIATPLAEAIFRAGTSAHIVSFNSLGGSQVAES